MPLSDGMNDNICRSDPEDGVAGMISSRAVLSQMAGGTDAPFRIICRKYGCCFAFTEMVDVNGIAYGNIKTLKYLDRVPGYFPLGCSNSRIG